MLFRSHYFKGSDSHAFLGWDNSSGELQWQDSGSEGVDTFTGNFGTMRLGNLIANASTAATSTSSGAIVTNGGLGVAGNAYIGTNLVVGSTNIVDALSSLSQSVSATSAAIASVESHVNTVSNAVSVVSAQLVSVESKLSNAISALSNAVSTTYAKKSGDTFTGDVVVSATLSVRGNAHFSAGVFIEIGRAHV